MQSNLTIEDPLDGQAVTIIVTLSASEKLKDERQALITVGVANQMPVLKTGVLGNLTDLIDEGWKAFGVQAEANKAEKKIKTAVAPELIAEVEIEVEETDMAEAIEPTPVLPAPAPKPASNLSLF